MRIFVNIFIGTALAALALLSASCADAKVRQYKVQVVKEYIHDETSFTQGLFFLDGEMIETPDNTANRLSARLIWRQERL